MKKVLSSGFAAALICGLNMFTSCSTDDNPVKPTDNLTEKIIGKWMEAEIDGKPALTAVTTREFQDYFVDGTLLATRWKNEGENELREWWEIKSLKGDKMQWKALRANDDGSTFQQIMDWEKVE
jgi:hypothetical protein